jgi:uncharacterized protein involved in exopolysaccharide biosynthesis
MHPTSWIRPALLVVAALLVIAGASVMLFVQPTFEAAARIKVEKEIPDVDSGIERAPFDPYWVQDQFEAIQSKVMLFRVITNLGLAERWGNLSLNEAYPRLKENLEVRQYRCTSLIEIRYWSKDRQQAADVVNAIATAFRDYKLEQRRAKREQRLLGEAAPIRSGVELIEVASPPQRPVRDPRLLGFSLMGLGGVLAAVEVLTRRSSANRD